MPVFIFNRKSLRCTDHAPITLLRRKVVIKAATACFAMTLSVSLTCKAECTVSKPADAWVKSPTFTMATLNVAHGRKEGLNQILLSQKEIKSNLRSVAAQLRATEAHAIALQEADAPSGWSGNFDHVALLASAADYPCYFHGIHDQSNWSSYGTALLSRYPLDRTLSHTFEPSWPTKPKGFVKSQLAWNPGNTMSSPINITLVSVHLDFSRDSVRQKQVEEIVAALKSIATPLVVSGDFNAEWSEESSAVRSLAKALQLHSFDPLSETLGTYTSDGKRLDWILISRQLKFLRYEVLTDAVSDHLTAVAEISLDEALSVSQACAGASGACTLSPSGSSNLE